MRISVIHAEDISLEEAHGGVGSRKLYIGDRQSASQRIQGVTHGWLPPGNTFDWHDHSGVEEIAYVLHGSGYVEDEDGTYEYHTGTVCVFPADTRHKIANTSKETSEFMFVRIYEQP